ncbi:MAG: hypothetical protein CVT62_02995 [Actinobacteria bacterium HGW-Actinobacteria-2]|nr:MAG: hypothetical protein CVT62_02995 [Actinobacteria bacterium HGW-Actinobacteria-2]
MFAQFRRIRAAAIAAVAGGASLAASWPLLGVVAEPSMCLGLSPEQALIGLHLHLVSVSASCANGFAATQALAPAVGITVAISLSALVFGLLSLALVGGGAVAVRTLLRRVSSWVRRQWVLVFEALLPTPSAAPVLVRVDGRPQRRDYSSVQRRGPPRSSIS